MNDERAIANLRSTTKPRTLKIRSASLGVCYLARLNYRFMQIL